MNKNRRIMLMAGLISGCLLMTNVLADDNVRYIIIDDDYAHGYDDHRWAKKHYKKHHKKHHDEYHHGERHHYRNKYRRDYHDYEYDHHHRREVYHYRPDRPHHYRSYDQYRPHHSDSRIGGRLVIDF